MPCCRKIDTFSDRINGELAAVTTQLGQLVGSLSGLPGRKQVLYVGGSLPVRAPLDLFQAWRDIYNRPFNDSDYYRSSEREHNTHERFMLDNVSSKSRYMAGLEMFDNLGRAASAADVAFHTVNVALGRKARRLFSAAADVEVGSGGTDQSNLAGGGAGVGFLGAKDGLEALSLSTGGRHTADLKSLDSYFAGLAGDQQTRYILGFTADPMVGESQRIEVRLKKKKGDRRLRRAVTRHRQHFTVQSRKMELAARTLSHLMIETETENPLGIAIDVGAPEARAEDWRLKVKVRIPLAQLVLVPDRRSHSGQLAIYATAGTLEEGFAPILQAIVPVRLNNGDLLTALGREAEYELDLRVPEDPGRVAVTVLDEFAATESTVTASVGKPTWLPETADGAPSDDVPTDRGPQGDGEEALP